LSRNGQVPTVDGVRWDGKKELLKIMDQLNSDAHNGCMSYRKNSDTLDVTIRLTFSDKAFKISWVVSCYQFN